MPFSTTFAKNSASTKREFGTRKLANLFHFNSAWRRYFPLIKRSQRRQFLKNYSRKIPSRYLCAIVTILLFGLFFWYLSLWRQTMTASIYEEAAKDFLKKLEIIQMEAEENANVEKQGFEVKDGEEYNENLIGLKVSPAPQFNRWAFGNNANLDCQRVLNNENEYIAKMTMERMTFKDPEDLEMDCQKGIKWRNYFPEKVENADEEDFPLAQARSVYRLHDYVFLEMELASAYSPNNFYCYSIDHKADSIFHERMHQLASCLPNVLIAQPEWTLDSSGHNQSRAYLGCMQMLSKPEMPWKYVAILQNHDTAIKTNRQMVQIYKWLDGANDVEVGWLPGGRVNETLDWSFEAIHMFRDEGFAKFPLKNLARNMQNSPNGFAPKLIFSTGDLQSSLSRPMVEFILNELDLEETQRRLESGGYGVDEILLPTLNAADALEVPGGFTHGCLDQGKSVQHITRATFWYGTLCLSHHMRHGICIFGLEHLALYLVKWPHLFANKFQPDFDWGAALCWYETMHNRSHIPAESTRAMAKLRRDFYEDLAHVRFQKFKKLLTIFNNGTSTLPYREAIKFFNCNSKYGTDNVYVNLGKCFVISDVYGTKFYCVMLNLLIPVFCILFILIICAVHRVCCI